MVAPLRLVSLAVRTCADAKQMFSASGLAAAGAIAASREKIIDASDTAKEELAELKKQFDALDKRSKLILRLILVLSGLDLFLAI